MEPILRWLAEVVAAVIQPIGYFSRPTYPASSDVTAEMRSEGVVEGAQAVVTVTEDAVARPTTVKSFASPVTADVMVDPDAQTNRAAHIALCDQEIQRRRDWGRMLFNDFWSGAYEKPAAFVERLDQAEDYVNERLAATGEFWQLDTKTRAMLGLPPRANSPNNEKIALFSVERFFCFLPQKLLHCVLVLVVRFLWLDTMCLDPNDLARGSALTGRMSLLETINLRAALTRLFH